MINLRDEQPTCKVTVLAEKGVYARRQMNEKSDHTALFANGHVIFGYSVKQSSEGIDHVRVSPIGDVKTKWIRISEKDGSNPLVDVEYIIDPESEVAVALTGIAQTIQDLTKTNKELVRELSEIKAVIHNKTFVK